MAMQIGDGAWSESTKEFMRADGNQRGTVGAFLADLRAKGLIE